MFGGPLGASLGGPLLGGPDGGLGGGPLLGGPLGASLGGPVGGPLLGGPDGGLAGGPLGASLGGPVGGPLLGGPDGGSVGGFGDDSTAGRSANSSFSERGLAISESESLLSCSESSVSAFSLTLASSLSVSSITGCSGCVKISSVVDCSKPSKLPKASPSIPSTLASSDCSRAISAEVFFFAI